MELDELEQTLAEYGVGYLLSWNADGRVKVVSIPSMSGTGAYAEGVFTLINPGRGSCANAAANAQVTLLFAPLTQPGFSLIVDGTASLSGDDVIVAPTSAILHRPAL